MSNLSVMQLDWTGDDWTNAAAVYGSECAFLMRLIKTGGEHDAAGGWEDNEPFARGYRAGCQEEAARMAIDFARRAAHAFFMAEHEYEKLALFLHAETAEVYEQLGKRDPRD